MAFKSVFCFLLPFSLSEETKLEVCSPAKLLNRYQYCSRLYLPENQICGLSVKSQIKLRK